MGLIREPKNVDFFVDPRGLTEEEKGRITDYIQAKKMKEQKPRDAGQTQGIVKTKKSKSAA